MGRPMETCWENEGYVASVGGKRRGKNWCGCRFKGGEECGG